MGERPEEMEPSPGGLGTAVRLAAVAAMAFSQAPVGLQPSLWALRVHPGLQSRPSLCPEVTIDPFKIKAVRQGMRAMCAQRNCNEPIRPLSGVVVLWSARLF